MLVDFREAVECFERLRGLRLPPSLHPHYVAADAARDPALSPCFFAFQEGGEIFYHGFHKAPIPGTALFDIQSPYGYSGPVASCADASFLSRAWEAYLAWCSEQRVLAEFIRFHPALANWRYYPGEVLADRQTVLVDLGGEEVMAGYAVRVRTAVRKAQKSGLRVRWCAEPAEQVEQFYRLYCQTMRDLRAEASYFFPKPYFEELLAWKRARLALCLLEGELVAAAIFLEAEGCLEYHLSASTPLGKRLSATNLILHEAAVLGKSTGCPVLHLGGGTDAREDNPLFFFKAGFSAGRGEFRIGRHIHDETLYHDMKTRWEKLHPGAPKRILFYRF